MTDPPDAHQRFKAEVIAHVQDLGAMCQYVMTRRFPPPKPGLFARTFEAWADSDADFDRFATQLAADAPVEREEGVTYRLVRRQFGTVALELSRTRPGADPVDAVDLADVAASIAEDDALERKRGLVDDD